MKIKSPCNKYARSPTIYYVRSPLAPDALQSLVYIICLHATPYYLPNTKGTEAAQSLKQITALQSFNHHTQRRTNAREPGKALRGRGAPQAP